jgi:polysaccharide biosynthesis/export protein
VSVYAYNSKSYYVVTEGAGLGDRVARYPITGNETVLDAISQIQGLQQVSSKKIWVARPAPSGESCDQILPVDWCAITQRGVVDSNYQLLPGDRVFVAEDKLVAIDTRLGKVIAPLERLFGVTALGNSTVRGFRNNNGNNGNNF